MFYPVIVLWWIPSLSAATPPLESSRGICLSFLPAPTTAILGVSWTASAPRCATRRNSKRSLTKPCSSGQGSPCTCWLLRRNPPPSSSACCLRFGLAMWVHPERWLVEMILPFMYFSRLPQMHRCLHQASSCSFHAFHCWAYWLKNKNGLSPCSLFRLKIPERFLI